jgi:chromosome partitioning protein
MRSFVVANPKGGAGKSTLATNLAGYFASRNYSVMLGDVDRQFSSMQWLKMRREDAAPIQTWEISRDKVARPPKGTTHVVLDTPAGLHGKLMDRVLKMATHVIIPVQPSLFDMLATQDFIKRLHEEKAVRKGRIEVAVIGMRVDARTKAAGSLSEFFSELELPVLTCLRDTQNYVHAASAGLTLFDMPRSRVEQDLAQWQPIIEWAEAQEE